MRFTTEIQITSLPWRKNKTKKYPQNTPLIIVSTIISQQQSRDTSSSLMWGTPKIMYNNAGKLHGSWITAYLFHVYPTAALLKARIDLRKIPDFYHTAGCYILYQPHWILLPEILWHVWIARMIVLVQNWMYLRPPRQGNKYLMFHF